MVQRGRKPSLKVLPFIPGQGGRPPPPPDLDLIEARIWRAVTDALPSFWVDPAGEIVLRRLCAQGAVAERREARLRQLRATGNDDGEEADELAVAHGVTAKLVSYLLGQLRATPRSRLVARAAGPQIESTPKVRPWEIRAGGKTA